MICSPCRDIVSPGVIEAVGSVNDCGGAVGAPGVVSFLDLRKRPIFVCGFGGLFTEVECDVM